ncbi:MAG: sigma-54 dependent transcriptional regulator [Desulfovibrio sp.]|jgi:DNA-binding NtrC family response regulator|nr:sigma-54 dependent transcriptional regulator [Desulfovibrio sp.]
MPVQRILFLAPAQTVTRIFPQLREAGMEVGIAENLKGASSFMRKAMPGLILARPSLPGFRIEDLVAVGRDDPQFPPVVVFSDRPSPEEASRLLELGVRDYWAEPLSFEKIRAVLPANKTPVKAAPSSTLGGRRASAGSSGSGPRIIGSNPALLRVLALAARVAKSRATVLISGESGTGKELFARYLHAESDRADRPFVAVNCAALPEHLLESELFGHEKGAFTGAIARKLGKFELASGGTILLDEISEMDLALQAKLLRVLQEGEIDRVGGSETLKVDVRVLATTNRDLDAWAQEGKFRRDLFFRLNVIPLRLPALRERGEDMLLLARFFVGLYLREYALPPVELSGEAVKWLQAYAWPGNVRELQNLMERAVLLSGGKAILPGHFLLENEDWPLFSETAADASETCRAEKNPAGLAATPSGPPDTGRPEGSGTPGEGLVPPRGGAPADFSGGVIPLSEMERIMIRKGLEQTGGNRTQAAELLGISVRTLRNKLNEYRQAGPDADLSEK